MFSVVDHVFIMTSIMLKLNCTMINGKRVFQNPNHFFPDLFGFTDRYIFLVSGFSMSALKYINRSGSLSKGRANILHRNK